MVMAPLDNHDSEFINNFAISEKGRCDNATVVHKTVAAYQRLNVPDQKQRSTHPSLRVDQAPQDLIAYEIRQPHLYWADC